jgi:hypothetical protein
MRIILFQSAVRDLHRSFLTHVGASSSDLVSGVQAVLVCRPPLRQLSRNPLTALYLDTDKTQIGQDIAGAPPFRAYLEHIFADLLSGPSADLTQKILSRTVDHPEEPFEAQDAHFGDLLMDSLRDQPNWTLWRPCCSYSSWYLQHPPPGTHHNTLETLVTSGSLITDGTAFYSPPPVKGTRTLVDSLHHGLMEGLRHHRLVDLIPRHPPPWRRFLASARPEPDWTHPRWIQFLNPEIRVTDLLL